QSHYKAFADFVHCKCPPLGRFLYGFGSGFNFESGSSDDPWFVAGVVLGVLVALDPLNFLGKVLNAFRFLGRLGKEAKALQLTAKAPEAADAAGRAGTALTKWDADFAAKQLLGGSNVTAGGRIITYHAASR